MINYNNVDEKLFRERLQVLEEDAIPVFVIVLHECHIDPELIKDIKKRLPEITLFVLTGSDKHELVEYIKSNGHYLLPKLDPKIETRATFGYYEARAQFGIDD